MFCLCQAEHKYCPTKASDRSLKLSTELGGVAGPIVCGKFWYEESPWGLVMNDLRAERRGEHVVQPFADGTKSELSSRRARGMGVCGSCGLTLHASGITPIVPGYIDSGSGLEFATGLLNADDEKALMLNLDAWWQNHHHPYGRLTEIVVAERGPWQAVVITCKTCLLQSMIWANVSGWPMLVVWMHLWKSSECHAYECVCFSLRVARLNLANYVTPKVDHHHCWYEIQAPNPG
ncbi:hypothetical protein CK203_111748 [Vitis vinifera]|uniref:Uncharacterized protein n=1 Tax=Vitis vinifera TaxID=29760 RepID=A0A438DNX0_VITVI|nr:hypothetical protein CK203_111748 [Vitis vinifera]